MCAYLNSHKPMNDVIFCCYSNDKTMPRSTFLCSKKHGNEL